ncbi:MAG: hypothetical protein ACYDCQ_13410 [Dehalococcoidia bacterium]
MPRTILYCDQNTLKGDFGMCDFDAAAQPDVNALITAEGRTALSELLEAINAAIAEGNEPQTTIERLRGPFKAFLDKDGWLPEPCRVPIPGKAASYALLRS